MKLKHSMQSMKKNLIRTLVSTLIAVTTLTTALAYSKSKSTQNTSPYQNEVFTKALYKKTVKIGFGTNGDSVVKDKAAVKKAYSLLAKMQLKQNKKNPTDQKDGFVQVTIYKKDGKTKKYTFSGSLMRYGRKTYTVVKNNPLDKLHKIFQEDPPKENNGNNQFRIAAAAYPTVVQYPEEADYINNNGELDYEKYGKAFDAWWEDVRARRGITGYADNMDNFLTKSAQQFLSAKENENRVYSPLNVYMALGMLAELTDGNSRQQILTLLGSKDIASLRKQSSDLWNAQYRNDKTVTSILAGSLWLNDKVNFIQPTLDTLAQKYYASSYQGEMGSAELNQALQDWLNEQTGGLLKNQASDIKLNPNTVLALATTLYYRAKWHDEFMAESTKQDTFHTDSGDVTCDFMHKKKADKTYYQGDKFSAVSESLSESGDMWFLLPDEGTSIDDLLNDSQAMEFLMSSNRYEFANQKYCLVNLSVPKFDVSSQFDLSDGLKVLGVTDVFDYKVSDFSPMTADLDQIYVSTAEHAGRVKIDEKGVAAAAYTVMMADSGAAMPPDEVVDFVLNRPFLFAVTGSDGLPLFVGVVNQP